MQIVRATSPCVPDSCNTNSAKHSTCSMHTAQDGFVAWQWNSQILLWPPSAV
jgi:hypothetical protein